ncbi:MAG: hypothetical protein WBA05_01975 [Gordonia sp. (in: high G+C Gram-positive bacteria)]|uniref:type VII secretion target n=1 Tax=Gordonia TaxID=2053 RepID=UPI0032671F50
MNQMTVHPQEVQAFGATAAALGTATGAVGAVDTVAVGAAVTAVFGLIGQEFAAAYAVAQANHLHGVGRLAAAHAATAVAATRGLAAFAETDGAGAGGIGV